MVKTTGQAENPVSSLGQRSWERNTTYPYSYLKNSMDGEPGRRMGGATSTGIANS